MKLLRIIFGTQKQIDKVNFKSETELVDGHTEHVNLPCERIKFRTTIKMSWH